MPLAEQIQQIAPTLQTCNCKYWKSI